MRSSLQRRLSHWLRYNVFASFEEDIRPEWLAMPDGQRVELDFFLPEHELAIEVQGLQHYEYSPFFHKTYENFQAQKLRDAWKRDVCAFYGITLLEIRSENEFHLIQERLKVSTAKPKEEAATYSKETFQYLRRNNRRFYNKWNKAIRRIARYERTLKDATCPKRLELARSQLANSKQALKQLWESHKESILNARAVTSDSNDL